MPKPSKDPASNAPLFASHAAAEPKHIDALYGDWFLDYASYVILERAVPHINDGFKPVQRRIMHSLWEKDDGRYNKVANVVGHCMQYHPHGDASIGDALVQLGQKELLIDTQGNWGNILTGDNAAAPRYIEARLSKLSQEILFSPKVTEWAASYDGRNKEPVQLPVKFPLLLAQGVEGIAVGLSCRILPHNFVELCDACVAALRNEPFRLMPDFPQAGMMDASDYNDGQRGGRVRVRARIEEGPKKNVLRITEIPFGTTAGSVMDSIVAANEKNKIKIAKVDDMTAEFVDVQIQLPPGADVEQTIQALYAFTDCEVSISPNAVVIKDGEVRQCGSPSELYENPNSRFVADFIGVSNLIEGTRVGTEQLRAGDQLLKIEPTAAAGPAQVALAVRPERLRVLADPAAACDNQLGGEVVEVAYHGLDTNLHVRTGVSAKPLIVRVPSSDYDFQQFRTGMPIRLGWQAEHARVLSN